MANRKWKIKKTKGLDGGGEDLENCLIDETATGFEFKDPQKELLSKTPDGLMPTLPFPFPDFVYLGQAWAITVDSLETGTNGKEAHGSWSNPTRPDGEPDGSWTADATTKSKDKHKRATRAYA